MITYREKGIGLHVALAEVGMSLWQHDGEWMTDADPAQVQAFIDAYTPSKAELLAPINARCEELLAAIKASYPKSEIDSWGKQEMEARAGGGPLTDGLAAARGIPADLLRQRIIAKADAYAAYSGLIIGTRQGLEDRVSAGELDVTWPEEVQ